MLKLIKLTKKEKERKKKNFVVSGKNKKKILIECLNTIVHIVQKTLS